MNQNPMKIIEIGVIHMSDIVTLSFISLKRTVVGISFEQSEL